jgi:hypothetical protein
MSDIRSTSARVGQDTTSQEPTDFESLDRRARTAPDVPAVGRVLAEVAALQSANALQPRRAFELEREAFARAREITTDAPERAVELLRDELVPRSLKGSGAPEHLGDAWRDILSEWVNAYPDAVARSLRAAVNTRLLDALRDPSIREPALWALGRIGARTPAVTRAVHKIARGRGPGVDAALRVLAWLGVDDEVASWIRARVYARARSAITADHVNTLRLLPAPETLDWLARTWWRPARWARCSDLVVQLLPYVPADVAAAYPDDRRVQRRALMLLETLAHEDSRRIFGRLVGSGGLEQINASLVPEVVLQWFRLAGELRGSNADGSISHWQYLLLKQAVESARPAQRRGWRQGTVAARLADALHETAVRSTAQPGGDRNMTEVGRHKREVWRAALHAGLPECRTWVARAAGDESNWYTLADVLNQTRLIGAVRLPPALARLVTARVEPLPGLANAELHRGLAAARYAGSVPSPASFRALLAAGVHVNGGALRDVGAALTSVTRALLVDGPAVVERRLGTQAPAVRRHVLQALLAVAAGRSAPELGSGASDAQMQDARTSEGEAPGAGNEVISGAAARGARATKGGALTAGPDGRPTAWQRTAAMSTLAMLASDGIRPEDTVPAVVALLRAFASGGTEDGAPNRTVGGSESVGTRHEDGTPSGRLPSATRPADGSTGEPISVTDTDADLLLEALSAPALASSAAVPPDVWASVENWALNRDDAFGRRAAAVFLKSGRGRSDGPVGRRLLEAARVATTPAPGLGADGWLAHAVGTLYERDPHGAVEAVVTLLRSDDWTSAAQLAPALVRVHTSPAKDATISPGVPAPVRAPHPLPEAIRDALAVRATRARLREGSDAVAFHLLLALAPQQLLDLIENVPPLRTGLDNEVVLVPASDDASRRTAEVGHVAEVAHGAEGRSADGATPVEWSYEARWPRSARADLAAAVRDAQTWPADGLTRQRLVVMVGRLLRDPAMRVRMAALEALRQHAPTEILTLAERLAGGDAWQDRRGAAECAAAVARALTSGDTVGGGARRRPRTYGLNGFSLGCVPTRTRGSATQPGVRPSHGTNGRGRTRPPPISSADSREGSTLSACGEPAIRWRPWDGPPTRLPSDARQSGRAAVGSEGASKPPGRSPSQQRSTLDSRESEKRATPLRP